MSPSSRSRIKDLYSFVDRALGRWLRPTLYAMSPLLLAKYRYRLLRGKRLNLKNPNTFDEKLLWLNLYWRHPLKTKCADKLAVRDYVAINGCGHLLPDLLGTYARSRDIKFEDLPPRFVLKCTHGCKFNIICRDKEALDRRQAKGLLDQWMKRRISGIWGEVHYDDIKPQIICEAYLEDSPGQVLVDYKVFCFAGKAHYTMVCIGRNLDGYGAKYAFFDRHWKRQPFNTDLIPEDVDVPQPEGYDRMIAAAEALAKPFPFVRMDFYIINGEPVFGEMTFTPDGCIDTALTDLAERVLGDLVHLPTH